MARVFSLFGVPAIAGMLLTLSLGALAESLPPDHPLRQPPKWIEVDGSALPVAEKIASPEVRTLLGYTRRALHLPDGNRMALFTYSNSAPANWIFVIDARDLTAERYATPNNDIFSHASALGADGKIYTMPYRTGRSYSFDPDTGEFENLTVALPDKEYTWDCLGASNGKIYFGTYPNAYFGEYDPASGEVFLEKNIVEGKKYTIGFSEMEDGRIRCKAWGPGTTHISFDPKTRTFEFQEEAEPTPVPQSNGAAEESTAEGDQNKYPEGDIALACQIQAGTRGFAITIPSGRFWEVIDGEYVLRGDPEGPAEAWFLEKVGDNLVGVSHYGIAFRYSLTDGSFERTHLDNLAPGGNSIMFLERIHPNCVIGANYSQQNLWKLDPGTGEVVQSPSMVARTTGEPMCAVGFEDWAYVGIYTGSIISRYDPNLPFSYGTNPLELIHLEPEYDQTRPRAGDTDGKRVFMTSDSSYNYLGGALVVIEPAQERGRENIEVYHHLIKDQNLPTLVFDPKTEWVWGGTDRWGQMRSHPPSQESSLIYAFDPETKKVVLQKILWRGADQTDVTGISESGILVAQASGEIALVDTESGNVLYQGPSGLPAPMPKSLERGDEDTVLYGLFGGLLCRWDLEENAITPVGTSPGCHLLQPMSGGEWVLGDEVAVYRLDLSAD
jgi:hypothetical protein